MTTTTLYRFKIDLSDIDRGVYEQLDFRLAQHPSETLQYLLTRAIAYVLNFQDGLEFSTQGLADPDAPALQINTSNGVELAIEIGNPSAKRLHKTSKNAKRVRVYTYKDPEVLLAEVRTETIHRAETIEVYAIDPKFLDRLAKELPRSINWNIMMQEGTLSIADEQTEIRKFNLG